MEIRIIMKENLYNYIPFKKIIQIKYTYSILEKHIFQKV